MEDSLSERKGMIQKGISHREEGEYIEWRIAGELRC
jgi:hypothetical protein